MCSKRETCALHTSRCIYCSVCRPFRRDNQGLCHFLKSRNHSPRQSLGLAHQLQRCHPQYPFWRLQNDELAEVSPVGPYILRSKDKEPTKTSLLEQNAHGGLLAEDHQMLQNDLEHQTLAIHKILDAHFPRSIHEDILDFFGLRLSGLRESDLNTDGEFKENVLNAYGRTCAFTGYSLSYRGSNPDLEAAHICWPQAGGNDVVSNGIAMTTLFRKLFHLGLVTVDESLAIRFSNALRDSGDSASSVLNLEGRLIRSPESKRDSPDPASLEWHRTWVFRT